MRAHISSQDGAIVPARTFTNESRPFCASLSDLKTNATGRVSSGEMSSSSPLISGIRPKSLMLGNHSSIALRSDVTPSSRTQAPANTGTNVRATKALPKRFSSSSCVTASPSRYFIIRSSSISTTNSMSCARAASAAA